MDHNIEIAVRIKPCEPYHISPLCYWDQQSIQVADKSTFSFDYVLPPDATQEELFQKIGFKIISNVLEGYNGCIFAYGQTGSGKTYTMTGFQKEEGIVQRCIRTLWNCVQKSQYFETKMSYFEIYNQTIKDLLSQKENLIIREKTKAGFYVQGLTQKVIQKYSDFQQLISHGVSVRTVKQTRLNQTSSRSHSVLEISVSYKSSREDSLDVIRNAKVTFIDLAGSEKQKETMVEGQRLKEAVNINKSLSTLSLVISKLSEISQKKPQQSSLQQNVHVPYRNSVLTKILKNSLTGKSKIIIVCTVSVEDRFIDETISTLRFAQTAKSIKMKVKRNQEQFDGTKDRLFEEFQQIKNKFNEIKDRNEEIERQNQDLKRQNAILKDQVEKQEAELNELYVNLECMKVQSNQMVREARSQIMSQTGQPMIYDMSQPKFLQSSSMFNYDREHQNLAPSLSEPFLREQDFIIPTRNFQQTDFSNFIHNQTTQLSFFTTNLSSQFNTPKKSFFTIEEADEKSQNGRSQEFSKIQQRIKILQSENKKLMIQKQFFLLDISLRQQQLKELTKRNVFLQAKQCEIQEGHRLFAELISEKQFNNAQLKFLKLCVDKSLKDQMALQLIEEEKRNQQTRINQAMDKVKKLLLSSVESESFCQKKGTQYEEARLEVDLIDRSSQSYKSMTYKSVDEINRNLNVDKNLSQRTDNQFQQPGISYSQYSKSQKKQNPMQAQDLFSQNLNRTPINFKKPSQTPMLPPMTQSVDMIAQFTQQRSQLSAPIYENGSQISRSSFRFTNKELQLVKKDYEKLTLENKRLKEEIERHKIMLMEKDSLLEQKQVELQEMIEENKKLSDGLQTEKYLLEMERKKNFEIDADAGSLQLLSRQINKKQSEIHHLRQYLQETLRKKQQQITTIRLQSKALQMTIERHLGTIQQLKETIQDRQRKYTRQNQHLHEEVQRVKNGYEQLRMEKGFLDSENQLLSRKYKQLKSIVKDQKGIQTPKKIYFKRVSCDSLSQSPQGQSSPIEARQGKLTEQQLIEIIETRKQSDMYQAAFYFHQKTNKLINLRTTMAEKINKMHFELGRWNQKGKEMKKEVEILKEKKKKEEKEHLHYKSMYLDARAREVQLQQQLYNTQQIVDELKHRSIEMVGKVQSFQIKLKQKQEGELKNRQKFNNLADKIKQKSLHKTPQPLSRNSSFIAKRRQSYNSPDSLSSQQTVVRTSAYIVNSRNSVQHARNSIQLARNQPSNNQINKLIQQIREVSNDDSRIEKLKYKEIQKQQFFKTPASIITHTVTNPNLVMGVKKERRLFGNNTINNMSDCNTQDYQDFDQNYFSQKDQNSKNSSIKSDSLGSGTNLRKSEHRNFSKK